MESYTELLNELLPGSPKDQYERVKGYEDRIPELYSAQQALRTLLQGLDKTPDDTQLKYLRNYFHAVSKVHFPKGLGIDLDES